MNISNGTDSKFGGIADSMLALGELGEAFALARSPSDLVAPLGQRFRRLVDSEEAWLLWPGPEAEEMIALRLVGGEGPPEWKGSRGENPDSADGCPDNLVRLYRGLRVGETIRLPFGAPENAEASLLLKIPASGTDAVSSMPVLKCLRGLLVMAFEAIHKGALLSRGKAEWEKAFDAASDLFIIHDPHGYIFRANMAVSSFAGLPIRQCVGSTCGHLFPGMCTDSDIVGMEWTHPESGRMFRVSTQIVNLSGREATLHVLHEVTEERNLASLASERQKLDLTKNMLQGIAHEIRNPLFGISTVIQALQARYAPDSEVTVYINTVLTEVTRLDSVVRRFLQLAFMDDHTPPSFAGVTDLLHTAVGLVRKKNRGLSDDQIQIKSPSPDTLTKVHKDTFSAALAEIVENALAAGGGSTRLTVEVTQTDREIILSFSDDGPGVAPEHLAKVFEPFFTTHPHKTGLGLSLAKAAIMLDGGSIEVRNNIPFPGASFLVTLPLASL
jgi:signal transduction histidine kinase